MIFPQFLCLLFLQIAIRSKYIFEILFRITVNYRIGSRKNPISQLHIRKIVDKKTAYNEGWLYEQIIAGQSVVAA